MDQIYNQYLLFCLLSENLKHLYFYIIILYRSPIFFILFYYSITQLKYMYQNIKCYIYFTVDSNQIKFASFFDPSQKDFQLGQFNKIIAQIDKKQARNLKEIITTTGIWYYRIQKKNLHLLLVNKQTNVQYVDIFLLKVIEFFEKYKMNTTEFIDKLKLFINDSIRLFNTYQLHRLNQLNQNIHELQQVLKGNLTKIIENITNLENLQQHSQLLSSFSINVQNDSNIPRMSEEIKRRWTKVILGLLVIGILAIIIYMINLIQNIF